MTCSQLVAQCFSDAGNDYEIMFQERQLDYNYSNRKARKRLKISLMDLVSEKVENKNFESMNMKSFSVVRNLSLPKTTSKFINLLNDPTYRNSIEHTDSSEDLLVKTSIILIMNVCEITTGIRASTPQEAVRILSEEKNFFITPDDLLSKAENLSEAGEFDKKLFSYI